MKPINEMSTAEMLAEHNALTGKNTKRFASRAAGEKQLAKAREQNKMVEQQTLPAIEETKDQRAEAIAKSWGDAEVAAKRTRRNGVLVDGKTEYRSVKAAFIDLGLPLGSHIKFRMDLKKDKNLEFQGHEFALI